MGQIRNLRVLSSADEMVAGGVISDKRPNPKNRKKLMKQRTGAAYVQAIAASYTSSGKVDNNISNSNSSDENKKKNNKILFDDGEKEAQKPKKKRF